jgi:hypothetical protein
MSAGESLEKYSLLHPQEVLLVHVTIADEADQVLVFKGFSSSLTRSTASDPDIPVIPDNATIQSIDRLVGPYNPNNPQYIERGLTWAEFACLL